MIFPKFNAQFMKCDIISSHRKNVNVLLYTSCDRKTDTCLYL